jgi:hypothetical protein
MLSKVIIFELGTHNQCVPPWASVLTQENIVITYPDNKNAMIQTLNDYGIKAVVIGTDQEYDLNNALKSSLKNSLVVLSTIPEYLIDFKDFGLLARIVNHKHLILCIRNIRRWTISSRLIDDRKNRANSLSVLILSLTSYLFSRYLLFRCKMIVFETSIQHKYFNRKFIFKRKTQEIMIFPGRLNDLTPGEFHGESVEVNKHGFNVGILGGWDGNRRDLQLIIKLCEYFLRSDQISIVLLGGWASSRVNSVDSSALLEAKSKGLNIAPEGYLTEVELFKLGSLCNVLISPLLPEWGFQDGRGTGSVADAIQLKKPIFFPEFLNFNEELGDLFNSYSDVDDLIGKINLLVLKPPSPLAKNSTTKSFTRDWLAKRVFEI